MKDNDYDYEYGIEPEAPKAWKIIKSVFKFTFLALIIFIYGFFILRICTSEPKREIIWTEKTVEAYESAPGSFRIYTQEPQIFIDEHDSEAKTGFNLSIFHITYIPSAKQLQVTVRLNKSMVPEIFEKYGDEVEDEPFVYSLRLDNGEQITGYSYKASKTNRYYFRYLVFDDVDLQKCEKILYTVDNSEVVDEEGNILAHETNADGSYILYPTDDDGYALVYDVNYIYLDAYYIKSVNRDEEPDACLMVYNRALKTDVESIRYEGETDSLFPTPYYNDKTPTKETSSDKTDAVTDIPEDMGIIE